MDLKETWLVEGLMPERALDRLQKAGIPVYKAKKIKKNGGEQFHFFKICAIMIELILYNEKVSACAA